MILKFRTAILTMIIALLPTFTMAQQLKISAQFDSSTIRIGDQVKLRFEIDQPANAKVTIPAFKDTITGKIEVLKTFPADSSRENGKLHIRQEFLITSFDSGYHYVASIAFPFEIAGMKDTLRSAPLYLRVFTMPVDSAKDIRDIKAPLKVPFSIFEYWIYILVGLWVIALALAIWYIITKRRKKESIFSLKRMEPAHVSALKDLDLLRNEKLWQQNKTKQYYTRLTEIIRMYIEKRFGVNALEQTSDEILLSLKSVYLEDQTAINLLKTIFSTSDLVKFAKGQPLPDENEINLLNAYQFVNNTKPNIPSVTESSDGNEKEVEPKVGE